MDYKIQRGFRRGVCYLEPSSEGMFGYAADLRQVYIQWFKRAMEPTGSSDPPIAGTQGRWQEMCWSSHALYGLSPLPSHNLLVPGGKKTVVINVYRFNRKRWGSRSGYTVFTYLLKKAMLFIGNGCARLWELAALLPQPRPHVLFLQ